MNRIVSGMRVTARIHLGNYHGALKKWIDLQNTHECFFFAADLHGLTTKYEHSEGIYQNSLLMIRDWLAAGLDPEKACIFIQSEVPEHAQLHLLLSMITPLSWLERVPTYKDQMEKLKELHLSTYGFLGYPVLQTADIVLYKAQAVPVGEDQVPHIELSREIVRRFNHLYNTKVFIEPEALLTKISKFPGLDGQKMSKSYNNTIELTEEPDSVRAKIKSMLTDPARIRRTDPGDPEKCPVWNFHKVYSDDTTKKWVETGCKSAGIGCIECKAAVADKIVVEQAPIIERAKQLDSNPEIITKVLKRCVTKARDIAGKTLHEANVAIGIAK